MERHVDPGVRSNMHIAGHPIHPMLVSFPIAFLIAAFVTDLVYIATGQPAAGQASFWLLVAGVATALIAAVPGAVDLFTIPLVRGHSEAWVHGGGNLLAVLLSVANLGMRLPNPLLSGSILTAGTVLSGVVAGLLVLTGWLGGELVYRHRIGVLPPETAAIAGEEEEQRVL